MMNRRTYDGWGYSPLGEITAANVARLRPVWSLSTGVINGHEAAPTVHDGVMFVATPGSQVIAIEAKTGTLLWRYRRPLAPSVINRHPTTRGVALLGDKVFLAASDAVLMALDARTGRTVWSTTVAHDNRAATTCEPRPARGRWQGAHRHVEGEPPASAGSSPHDPDTGKELWKIHTVPAPERAWSDTWPKNGEQWKTGGGSVWVTGTTIPKRSWHWGTGNGGPWMGDQRPGDNLYTARRPSPWTWRRDRSGATPVHAQRIVRLGRSVAADSGRLQRNGRTVKRGSL
jgi:alcohol dehydrogenase (cytochrome c)